ncbi:uncharacterized protein [Haliotis asinina]|uniref:uncharacterized protein n=1 Tax=Haliotis asinina TaxID=109174 RepID=UPI003531B4E4
MTISFDQRPHGPCTVMSGIKSNGTCSDSQLQLLQQFHKTTITDFGIVHSRSSFINTMKGTEYDISDSKHLKIPPNREREQSGTAIHQERTACLQYQPKKFTLLNNQRSTKKYINSTIIYYNTPDSKSGSKINDVETTKCTVLLYCGVGESYTTGDESPAKWESPVCTGSRTVKVQECLQQGRYLKQEDSEFHNGMYFSKPEILSFSDNMIYFHISLFLTFQNGTEFEHNNDRDDEDYQYVNTGKDKTNMTMGAESVCTCWKRHPRGTMCEKKINSNKPTLSSDLGHGQTQGMTDSHTTNPRLSIQKEPSCELDFGIVSSGQLPVTRRASVTEEHRPAALVCDIKVTLQRVNELCALYEMTGIHQKHEEYGGAKTIYSDGNTYLYHQSSSSPTKGTETVESKLTSKDMFRHFDIESYIQSLPIPTVAPFVSLQGYFLKIANHDHVSNEEKMVHEALRLSSFSDINVSASCIRLASAGFYATGCGDETRCFSCGVRHTGWREGDNISFIHKHKSPTCLHALGTDQRNIPIHPPTATRPFVLDTSDDAAGMAPVMHKDQNVITNSDDTQTALQVNSANGACFESRTRSVLGETPFQTDPESVNEDGNDTTDLAMASGGAVISSFVSVEPTVQSDSATRSQNNLEMNSLRFENAAYPIYLDTSRRLASFLLWPSDHCKKPAELVEAGFFYAGFSDCVRCFACGIGLKTWEKDDDPWVEHVRRRASCAYVRVTKGEAFITHTLGMEGQRGMEHEIPGIVDHAGNMAGDVGGLLEREACQRALEMGFNRNCVSKHALDILMNENHTFTLEVLLVHILAEGNLEMPGSTEFNYNEPTADSGSSDTITSVSRPTLQGHNQSMIGETVVGRLLTQSDSGHTHTHTDTPATAAAVGSKIPVIPALGTEQKHKQNKEETQTDPETGTAIAEQPRGHADEPLTYPRQKHNRQAYENTVSDEDEGYGDSSEMSEEMMFQSLPVISSRNKSPHKPKKLKKRKSTKEQRKAAEEETQQLKESSVCKICLEDPANIVFLPCGHLVACAMCAPALERCPVCRKHNRGSVRVYLANHLKNNIPQRLLCEKTNGILTDYRLIRSNLPVSMAAQPNKEDICIVDAGNEDSYTTFLLKTVSHLMIRSDNYSRELSSLNIFVLSETDWPDRVNELWVSNACEYLSQIPLGGVCQRKFSHVVVAQQLLNLHISRTGILSKLLTDMNTSSPSVNVPETVKCIHITSDREGLEQFDQAGKSNCVISLNSPVSQCNAELNEVKCVNVTHISVYMHKLCMLRDLWKDVLQMISLSDITLVLCLTHTYGNINRTDGTITNYDHQKDRAIQKPCVDSNTIQLLWSDTPIAFRCVGNMDWTFMVRHVFRYSWPLTELTLKLSATVNLVEGHCVTGVLKRILEYTQSSQILIKHEYGLKVHVPGISNDSSEGLPRGSLIQILLPFTEISYMTERLVGNILRKMMTTDSIAFNGDKGEGEGEGEIVQHDHLSTADVSEQKTAVHTMDQLHALYIYDDISQYLPETHQDDIHSTFDKREAYNLLTKSLEYTFPTFQKNAVEELKCVDKDSLYDDEFTRYVNSWKEVTVAPFYSLRHYFRKVETGEHDEKMRYEALRLGSFCGININVFCIRLAEAGFYATGDRDETRCFSCGVKHRGWQRKDNPFLIHRQLSPSCPLITGDDMRNVPINPNAEPSPFSVLSAEVNPSAAGDAGFASGTNDVLSNQPQISVTYPSISPISYVSCDGGDKGASASPELQHPSDRAAADAGQDPTNCIQTFEDAVYPNYSDIKVRMASFKMWPQHHCKRPEELVPVGFFYAGYSDCVRCFVCGVGLKTWEEGDDPWVEHVRWRSSCNFVKAIKGDLFITQTLAVVGKKLRTEQTNTNTESRRPETVSSWKNPDDILERETCQHALEMGYSRDCVRKHALYILRNYGSDSLKLHLLVERILQDDVTEMPEPAAATIQTSAASLPPTKAHVLPAPGGETDTPPPQSQSPPEQQEGQDESGGEGHGQRNIDEQPTFSFGNKYQSMPILSSDRSRNLKAKAKAQSRTTEDLEATVEETQQLRQSSACKICLEDPANIVFLPCGHLVACAVCAPALERCPVCRKHILGSVRIHLADMTSVTS